MIEFIPINPSTATGSGAPGSYAGHSRVPSRHRGRPASRGDPVFDNATALDTAVHVLDPQPTVMQGLVGPLLFQGEFLTTGFLGGHEDLDLGQRKREEAQIL